MKAIFEIIRGLSRHPALSCKLLRRSFSTIRGFDACAEFSDLSPHPPPPPNGEPNPLRAYFDSHLEGPGIWKFHHYFDIYHRHLSKFRGRPMNVMEIGIYSGGSLQMWKEYFGPDCTIYGVDIAPECKVYQDDRTKVLIGDQGDRAFWKRVRQEVPQIDVLIDDGAHTSEEQIVTLEEMLPHIRPGGVFLCEDILGKTNHFIGYCQALIDNLNEPTPNEDKTACRVNPLQRAIDSIHYYPFVTVIEKAEHPRPELRAPKHGTEWQPFYKVGM
jgi:hypothetical protein